MSLALRCSTLCAALLISSVAAADVIISDGDFEPGDWSVTVGQSGPPGSSASITRVTDGNPGFALEVEHVVKEPGPAHVAALHLYSAAQFNPSSEGALLSVAYSVDYRNISSEAPPSVHMGNFFSVMQDGNLYAVVSGHNTGSQSGWQTFANTYFENDFQRIELNTFGLVIDPLGRPDFSASGSPMMFGFVTTNSDSTPTGVDDVRVAMFDNVMVSVSIVPEPSSAALFFIGMLACWHVARRRGR